MVARRPQRGEVWWGELPNRKARPYLVMTRSWAIPVLHEIIVAAVTRSIRGIATEVRLGPDDGLPTECAASFDNLDLASPAHLTKLMCTLGPDRMADACAALRAAVDC